MQLIFRVQAFSGPTLQEPGTVGRAWHSRTPRRGVRQLYWVGNALQCFGLTCWFLWLVYKPGHLSLFFFLLTMVLDKPNTGSSFGRPSIACRDGTSIGSLITVMSTWSCLLISSSFRPNTRSLTSEASRKRWCYFLCNFKTSFHAPCGVKLSIT